MGVWTRIMGISRSVATPSCARHISPLLSLRRRFELGHNARRDAFVLRSCCIPGSAPCLSPGWERYPRAVLLDRGSPVSAGHVGHGWPAICTPSFRLDLASVLTLLPI